ncbi:MAG: Ribosomal protein S12 methylthiotransferase RimO [Ignavibacteria bacterium]|nr:Ribosomal protein S12 methylthiotransferase RimO [Ignavibacteria bacterium]
MKLRKDKIKIITLGCSKNLVDSEHIHALLQAYDFEMTDDELKADNILINTCGFIEAAKKESIETIVKAVSLKAEGKIKNVYVAGCLSDRYKNELEKEIPEVDKYFGSTDKPNTISGILSELGIDYKNNLIGQRTLTTPSHFAYLKISEGCDNPCSFCAIPIMRGRHVSKPPEQILTEARNLASKGVKELIIIGQDTTCWGLDIYGKRELGKLLGDLSKIDGIHWIRLMYAYPSRFPEEVIEVIKSNEKICNYIDIPIQHISDNVLKSMRRGITRKNQTKLLEKIRNEIPEVAVRTTLITGYPEETENDFKELINFVEEYKFERLGVFTYSNEDNTFAANLPDRIPLKEKINRQKTLLEIQKNISIEKNKESINKTFRTLIDRKENNYFIGRSYKDAPEIDQEIFINESGLKTGEFYDIRIFDAEEFDLFGELEKKL